MVKRSSRRNELTDLAGQYRQFADLFNMIGATLSCHRAFAAGPEQYAGRLRTTTGVSFSRSLRTSRAIKPGQGKLWIGVEIGSLPIDMTGIPCGSIVAVAEGSAIMSAGGVNEPGSDLRIGSCLGHVEQRQRGLPRVKAVLGHDTKYAFDPATHQIREKATGQLRSFIATSRSGAHVQSEVGVEAKLSPRLLDRDVTALFGDVVEARTSPLDCEQRSIGCRIDV
jgi:hypothetical protein